MVGLGASPGLSNMLALAAMHGAHGFSVYLYTAHSISGHSLTPIATAQRYPLVHPCSNG